MDGSSCDSATSSDRRVTPIVHVLRGAKVGGAELQLLALLRALDRQRFPSRVVVLGRGGPLAPEYARLCPVDEIEGPPGRRLFHLTRLLRLHRPAVVHTWLARLWGTTAALAAGTPVVAAFRGIDDGEASWRVAIKRRYDRLVACRIPVVAVANSHAVARFVVRFSGIPARRTVVIGNILERQELHRIPLMRPASPFVVGIIGRLEPVKDHRTFLRAAAALRRHRPDARFLIAGDGSSRQSLHSEARTLGIADACEFLGHVSDVSGVLARCHATVHSSVSEGMPNAIIEALAAGVPVVTTATEGACEIVRDGENGFVAPIGDAEGLAERLSRLAADEHLRQRLGNEARRRMLSSVAPSRVARRYQRLYTVLATKNRS